MDISVGLLHLTSGPPPFAEADLPDDLLLAAAEPGQHLALTGLSLVAPVFKGGAALAAAHALLLACRHDRLLLLQEPPSADQSARLQRLQLPAGEGYVVLPDWSAGDPPLPALLHRSVVRPLERALRSDPAAISLPPGLRVVRLQDPRPAR